MFRRIFPWIFSGAHTSTPEVNDFPVTPPKKPPEIPKPEVDLEDSKITAKIQAIKVLAEDIVLFDNDNHDNTIEIDGQQANLKMGGKRPNGDTGKDGDIWLFAKDGDRSNDLSATIHLDADTSGIRLRDSGGNTTIHLDGDASGMSLRDSGSDTTIYLQGEEGNLKMGGKRTNGKDGKDGDILLFAKDGDRSKDADATIHLDGDTGFIRCNGKMEAKDLCCTGADYAEEFGVSATGVVEPGTVMVIDEAGGLRPATEAYDKKVAGIVSGAGNLNPGVILDRQPGKDDRVPVALMGKVYCKVDAQYAPVEVGDLLTTSATPGYAMKATEPTQAYGAILGKALRAIDAERGLIPVLVTLQ
jgi:hypothetical protein